MQTKITNILLLGLVFVGTLGAGTSRADKAYESITCSAGEVPSALTPDDQEPRPLTLRCLDEAAYRKNRDRVVKRAETTKYCPAGQSWMVFPNYSSPDVQNLRSMYAKCLPR